MMQYFFPATAPNSQTNYHKFASAIMILLSFYFAIGLVYLFATPIFEASDEYRHFGMLDYIHRNHALPVQDPDNLDTLYHQEGSQPPLYYLISALITAPIDFSNFVDLANDNPHAQVGLPHSDHNKNIVLHDSHPLEGVVLAIYILRIVGLIFGGMTVYIVYQAGILIAGRRIGLFAAGITAFNPMYLFIMASVNNDTLVTLLSSAALYLIIRLIKEGFNIRRDVLLAFIIALATLTKLSGLVIVLVAAIVGLGVSYLRRDWRGLVTLGGAMLGIWLIIAGWWYLRNIQLYGELFGTSMMVQVAGARLEPFTFQTFLDEFEGLRITYWGLFGGVNIFTQPLFYWVMDAISLLAGLGIAWVFIQRRHHQQQIIPLLALGLTVFIGFITLINWTSQTYASQGRLLFPYTVSISIFLAIGLNVFFRAQWFHYLLITALAGYAIATPILWIAPHYTPAPAIEALPDDVILLDAQYGEIQLIGYEYNDQRYQSGDKLNVTLYWQPLETSDKDYSLYLHVLDPNNAVISKIDTYPAGGLRRTSTWEAGLIYPDTYTIPLEYEGAFDLKLLVGWWHLPTQEQIPVHNASGEAIPSVILHVGGFSDQPNDLDEGSTVLETFAETIELIDYDIDSNGITFTWHSIATPDDDYVVFVQVLELEQGEIIAQSDAPPILSTKYWRDGDVYQTYHPLALDEIPSDSAHHILIGWYRRDDFWRLPTETGGDAFIIIE